ncbi:unnamed protein product [Bursaphelenchus xylophilus]|uniref:(pine wood nematode) hypothetical protein n=1 Tax=Bursaphelenchus xylophilus TaxID=6326 RepID=A0A7I8WFW6_BURXY|nr:unnamed protein product [Bursaphelenchus xylophilus]CAG9111712.1 unnamed protein product [Bursaphelenchus xylophilus]
MKCVAVLCFLAFSMVQGFPGIPSLPKLSPVTLPDIPSLPNVLPVTLPEPQEPLLEALVQILNQILEDLHLPTVDPEAVTFPELGVEGDRVKRDIFSGVTGLPPSPLVVIIELLNKILESLNLPTVNSEAVTIPSDAGRVKRDAFEPVTAEPTFDVLLDILNQILECLHLPTINPEEVTVPSEEGGRAKRDIPFGITLPSENPLAELIAKLLEIIAKLESFEFGTGAPVPVTFPSL